MYTSKLILASTSLVAASTSVVTSADSFSIPHFLHDWQDFFGAMVGALVALTIFVLTEWHKSKRDREQHWHFLHRSITAALDNLAEIDLTIHNFANDKLNSLIKHIDEDIEKQQPSLARAFVPLLHIFQINEELLRRYSGSGYVDILTISLVNKSKDLGKIIDDINRQFEETLEMHTKIVVGKLNQDPTIENLAFKENILKFKSEIIGKDFELNVRYYARLLIKAQLAVSKLQAWKVFKWKKTFKNAPKDKISEYIDNYFAEEIKQRMVECQPSFKTDLLKKDEEGH